MTKLGIISTYQRLLYTSAVKKDFYKSSRSFASSPGSGAQEGQAGVGNEISKTTEGSSKENTTTAEEGRGGNETFTTMAQQNENLQTSNLHRSDHEKSFDFKTGHIGGTPIQQIHVDKLKSNLEDAKKLALVQYEVQKKFLEDKSETAKALLEDKMESVKAIFGVGGKVPTTPEEEWYAKRVSFWMKRYENFVGLTEVKAAQARVVKYEKKFIDTQELRREAQSKITDIQKKIKDIHLELEKTHRGEDRYLVLVTQEHQVLKDEKQYQEEFKQYEKTERECFSALSNAVRDSHEKERAQAEKTKYWSLLGSILGTCLGIIGTTINNRMRMNELRRLVSQNSSVEEIRAIGDSLQEDFSSHRTSLAGLVTAVEGVVTKADSSVGNLEMMEELCGAMKEASSRINVRTIDTNLAELREQQQLLSGVISEHREQVDSKVQEILEDMYTQRKELQQINMTSSRDRENDQKVMDKREAEFRSTSDSLNQKSAELKETMMNSVKSIDEKMKDVRSLLLHQAQVPKETEKWIEKLERVEKTQMLLLQRGFDNVITKLDEAAETRRQTLSAMRSQLKQSSHDNSEMALLELDNMSGLMRDHQRKTQHAVVMTGLVVGVVTPLVMIAINKLL